MSVLFVAADDTLLAPSAAAVARRSGAAGALSAGIVAGEMDWLTRALLAELGVDLAGHLPTRLDLSLFKGVQLVVTLDEVALEHLPELPAGVGHGHLPIVAPVPPDVHALQSMLRDLEAGLAAALGEPPG